MQDAVISNCFWPFEKCREYSEVPLVCCRNEAYDTVVEDELLLHELGSPEDESLFQVHRVHKPHASIAMAASKGLQMLNGSAILGCRL